jgi:hypothetical protein
MSDESERKTDKPKIEPLELNRETVQDLSELETDAAKGGVRRGSDACESLPSIFLTDC